MDKTYLKCSSSKKSTRSPAKYCFSNDVPFDLIKAGACATQAETSLLKQYVVGERVDLLDDYDFPARTITETIWNVLRFEKNCKLMRCSLTDLGDDIRVSKPLQPDRLRTMIFKLETWKIARFNEGNQKFFNQVFITSAHLTTYIPQRFVIRQLIPKTIRNRKGDCAWGCAQRINTTSENLQIEKHKSGRRPFRSPDWFVLFDLQIFWGGVYPPSATSRTISFSISNSFWY